jgi:predicted dehydrogenase
MDASPRGWPAADRANPLRVGVVGGGLVAQVVHLPLLRALPEFRLVALAEPSPSLRAAVGARWAIPALFATHRELLERERVDALVVCSPNGSHVNVVLDALGWGVDVLVEKPLCLDPEDADRIAAARDRARRVVQVGYMKHYDPAVEALLADLGPATALRHLASLTYDPGLRAHFAPAGMPRATDVPAAVTHELAERTAAQVAAAVGTGDPQHVGAYCETFLGALVHDVALGLAVLDAIGLPVTGIEDAFGAPDGSAAGGTLTVEGGPRWTLAWLLLAGAGDFRQALTLHADDAVHDLEFPAPYLLGAPTRYTRLAGGVRRTVASWDEAYARQLRHFHACVTTGVPCRTPPERARRDVELLAALFRRAIGAEVPA